MAAKVIHTIFTYLPWAEVFECTSEVHFWTLKGSEYIYTYSFSKTALCKLFVQAEIKDMNKCKENSI